MALKFEKLRISQGVDQLKVWRKNGELEPAYDLNRARLDGEEGVTGRALIRKRINRIRLGNLGNNRSVGGGVWELKIDFGPGHRIYYGEGSAGTVILLCGGNKESQAGDILRAKEYWRDYLA
jgi:putative addiction module killer protein